MRRKDQFDRDALHFAPFVLFPTSFPRDDFYRAMKLQPVLNELMHKVNKKIVYYAVDYSNIGFVRVISM